MMDRVEAQPKAVSKEEIEPVPEQTEFHKSVESLIQGCELIKLKGASGKLRRYFHMKPDWQSIVYESSRIPCYLPLRTVEIGQLKEVRKGFSTDSFNVREKNAAFREKYDENRCFSLVLRTGKILDLIAPNKKVRDTWTNVLQQLVDRIYQVNRQDKITRWLKVKFNQADKGRLDGCLDLEESIQLLKGMNIKFSRDKALWLFNEALPKRQPDGVMALDSEGFQRLYKIVSSRPEITMIFEQFCANKEADTWTAVDLRKFLLSSQKQDPGSIEACDMMIEAFEPLEENKEKHLLSVTGLTNLLLSPQLYAFDPNCAIMHHDMTQPLTSYFIASSHNSYLMDHQLTGTSSIEAYISCLMAGCRCIELDCWDGDDGEPVITHGRTLTSAIHFEDVVQVVKDYGFKISQYPVILSLENHCSIPQQNKMAEYLQKHLGDMLFVGPVKTSDKACPSPEFLKTKVLIKAKKLPEELHHDAEVVDDVSDTEDPAAGGNVGDKIDGAALGKLKKTEKISKALSDCVYLKATKFSKFGGNEDGKFFEMSSVSESKITTMLVKDHTTIISHCQRQLVRVYPAATRFDSTNFNAIPIFDSGCQIVALNYQNHNKATQAYKAKFRDNGGCGYLLKPEFMRTPGLDVGLFEASRRPWLYRIRVISGQHLPKPPGTPNKDIIDPYVTVQIIGREYDKKKLRTRMVKNNGFNPVWDTQLDFKIHNQDMAVLRLKVKDQDNTSYNTLIGHYNIPVICLQQGYRHVELYDKSDLPLELATIFLHVSKEEVP
ncbi:1-phosphatidylinositol 4,5-bisphosphate phosphodiesterase delta-1 [Hypsibius exemplaris]|uniref:Phosphoinositide phospholipase C n=1 Tax=Hypsibius exemplaris TaxID=2072580 RepID=A0A1W0WQF4_HYPEX|nr:1-phosphatidylinositol 4,5-bisphosphate phosphodiesterase delta-1 [Hypsibius exemplaris]